ncbi:hypothetical protein QUB68_26550 [Microcoleus sp. A006_D1]|uniref:hypothetical protein n=1 Tax=Microcoleus sp. A006_D1 TaxID=3055267 RepID=UPI002FCF2828
MIPAPVTRSATTVPGSGIDVALCEVAFVYIGKVGGGADMGGGDNTTDGGVAGDIIIGSGVGSGDATSDGGGVGSIIGDVGGGTSSNTGGGVGSTIGGVGDVTWSTIGGGVGSDSNTGAGATMSSGEDTGEGFTEDGGIGSGEGSGDAVTGSATAAGDCRAREVPGAQALEKFPGPHTSTAAEAGGAAAR